jgi:hypothetical protein
MGSPLHMGGVCASTGWSFFVSASSCGMLNLPGIIVKLLLREATEPKSIIGK